MSGAKAHHERRRPAAASARVPSDALSALFEEMKLPLEDYKPGQRLKSSIRRLITSKPPSRLHHYVGAQGLLGFLKSRSKKEDEVLVVSASKQKNDERHTVWASLATHLNDHDEIVHGQRMIRAEFEKLRRSGSNGRLLSGLRRRGKVIDWDAALDPERPWADVYVTCFTQLEDSLRMWRGYGAERGYALTFDVGALRGKAFLVNVRYDRRRAAAWIRDLLRSLVAFYKAARNDRKLTVNSLVEALKQGLGLAAAIFKREQWRDEQEWRLIEWFSKERTLEFRERDGRIVPYLEVAIPEAFQLKEITIGPGHHHAIEKKAVELLKRRYLKGQRIKVRQSKVSLRPH